jgi:endonuclease/exonuclease/phosphatase family metal-dependent hydrolase
VLTLNLFGQGGGWTDRRSVLVRGLCELRPDLVAFQEPIVSNGYDQVVDLLGSEYQIAHANLGLASASDHQGTAIASRWPLKEVHEVDLHLTPRTADFPCTTLVAEVAAPMPIGPLLFVNHLPSWQLSFEHERQLQAVAAARFVEDIVDRRNLHVVLAGDLDADPDAASVRFWTGRQALDSMSVCYRDAWESAHPGEPGYTFTPENGLMNDWDWPFRRIDYLMVRCGEHGGPTLDIAECVLAFSEPVDGVWASDHFGVVADLVVPPQSPVS